MGRSLLEYLKENNISEIKGQPFIIDAPSSGQLNMLEEESVLEWLTGRAEGSSLKEGESYDFLLHFAVYTDALDKSRDPSLMLENNLRSFMNFHKYSSLYKSMIYTGSGAEYDKRRDITEAREEWLEEGKSPIPTDQYGLMKYTIGQLINQSSNIYNLRIFGLFGCHEYPFRFITQMCHLSIEGQPLKINRNVYFDYLYIEDFCRLLLGFMSLDRPQYHSYNIVSGRRISLTEICGCVNAAAKEYGLGPQPVVLVNEGLSKEYTASSNRLFSELGGYECLPMAEAVKKLYGIYLNSLAPK